MTSDELGSLADKLFGYAAKGRSMEPEVCAAMAAVLLDHAHVVRVLETLPFDVTMRILDEIKGPLP